MTGIVAEDFVLAVAFGDYETAYLLWVFGAVKMGAARLNHASIEGHYDYAPVK